MDTIGATLPKVTELKFQQNAILEALILVENDSTVRGFKVPSVIPINISINSDKINLVNDITQSGTLLKPVALLDQSRRKITYNQLNILFDIAEVICNMMKTKADIE